MAEEKRKPDATQSQPEEVAALRAELAEVRATMALLLRNQQQVSPDTLWAKEQMKSAAIEGAQAAIAAYVALSTEKRSQLEANKRGFTGKKLFRVLLGTGKLGEWPPLIVPADIDTDARGRYQDICGILSVNQTQDNPERTRWHIIDVTSDANAQAAIKETWSYQPA